MNVRTGTGARARHAGKCRHSLISARVRLMRVAVCYPSPAKHGGWRHNLGGSMKLDLLAIAAHPDDVELTCGGTLLKAAEQGYKTGILDLTAGEMGTRGTPETRAKEAALAAKILNVSWRGNLGVPDSDVQPARQNKMRLAQIIRDLRPRTV